MRKYISALYIQENKSGPKLMKFFGANMNSKTVHSGHGIFKQCNTV